MRVFSVELKALGEISQLPDSQKLFGALVYFLKQNGRNENHVSSFVKRIKDRDIYLSLSNLMPNGYLPVPKSYLESRAKNPQSDDGKAVYHALKKRDFATKEWIANYQNEYETISEASKADDYISLKVAQQVHINTDGRDENTGETKNLVFSVQRTILKYNHEDKYFGECQFYIRCENSCEIIDLLKANLGYIFTLGKRSSQGYNLFKLIRVSERGDIEQLYTDSINTYLNLGMLLPHEINFIDPNSFLDLFSSERRTFSSDKWNDSVNRGYFISFIAAGSIVVTDSVMTAGKCVLAPGGRGKDGEIAFGNAFLLPWRV